MRLSFFETSYHRRILRREHTFRNFRHTHPHIDDRIHRAIRYCMPCHTHIHTSMTSRTLHGHVMCSNVDTNRIHRAISGPFLPLMCQYTCTKLLSVRGFRRSSLHFLHLQTESQPHDATWKARCLLLSTHPWCSPGRSFPCPNPTRHSLCPFVIHSEHLTWIHEHTPHQDACTIS